MKAGRGAGKEGGRREESSRRDNPHKWSKGHNHKLKRLPHFT